jgi:thiol peroxidase
MPHPPLVGKLPGVGVPAPQLRFVKQDKSDSDLASMKGDVVILAAYPSIDTSTCAAETRSFNKLATGLGARILIVSMDLPFAQKRFCAAEGIENVETGSDFRYRDMADRWNAAIAEGNMRGTHGRVTWVIDREGSIRYEAITPELGQEPDYDAVINVVKQVL